MRFLLCLCVLATCLCAQGAGVPLFAPIGVDVDSGMLRNDRDTLRSVWMETLSIPGATSLQIEFDVAELPLDGSFIEVRSARDTMRLDAQTLKLWRLHTAHFNGDTLEVSLFLAPGAEGRAAIARVWTGIPRPQVGGALTDSTCGLTDDRVLSANDAVCRLLPSGAATGGVCSGFLVAETSTVLSAGSCASASPSSLVIAQFNVPASNAAGALQHPAVSDQYPVHQNSLRSEAGAPGDDWAVFRLHPNSSGQTAWSRQLSTMPLASGPPTYSPPAFVPTLRATGYGADLNDITRNFAQQTATGPMAAAPADALAYRVDTAENGGRGSPIIYDGTGETVAIHNGGGCLTSGGANEGTSVYVSDLANALTQVRGDGQASLNSSGTTFVVSQPSTIFSYAAAPGVWNVIGITSTSDWDIETTPNTGSSARVASAAANQLADVLVANGRLGTAESISGRIYRFAGTQNARAQGRAATVLSIDQSTTVSLSSSDVVRAFEFQVPNAGNFDVTIAGDPSWRWRLLAPSGNSDWRGWITGSITSGTVGAGTVAGLGLGTGWHCLVVTRDGGTAVPAPSDLTVAVCASAPALALSSAAGPLTFNAACQAFQLTPIANRWNLVGVSSSASDFSVEIGSAHSSIGSANNFALANGALGVISPTTGAFVRFGPTGGAVAQAFDAIDLTLSNAEAATIPAGHIGRLYQFEITSPGGYDIALSGDPGLFFRIYAPGTDARWVDRLDSVAAGSTGSGLVTATLATGRHALFVYRNAGPLLDSASLQILVCPNAPTLVVPQSPAGVPNGTACRHFSIAPQANRWNAVGVYGPFGAYEIVMGNQNSSAGNAATSLLVSDGRAGPIALSQGSINRVSGTGGGTIAHANVTTLTVDQTFLASWQSDTILRVFEFEITAAGSYDLTVSDPSNSFSSNEGPYWRVYTPASDAAWRPRFTSVGAGLSVISATTRTLSLNPGWHCIVAYREASSTGLFGNISLRVARTPNPVPLLSSLNPNPLTAGSGDTQITLSGSNFVPSSVARIQGVAMPTTFVNAGTLTAIVPAAQLTVTGSRSISVFSPAPAGGTSANVTLNVVNPVPTLLSLSPSFAVAGAGNTLLTVNGNNFRGSSIVLWNGLTLATNFVDAQRLDATIPSNLLATAGTVANVQVQTPGPGGGTSTSLPFNVRYAAPTVSAIGPQSRIAGTTAFTLDVVGTGFGQASEILFQGTPLATTFIATSLVRATVPAALINTPGSRTVTVRNPAPGGGTAVGQQLVVLGPTLTSIDPAVIPIQAANTNTLISCYGTNFHQGSVVYANSDPLPTTFITETEVQVTINSLTQPVLRVNGALVLSVLNAPRASSNFRILQSGGASNRGVIARSPIAPEPGEGYALEIFNGTAGSPFTLVLDAAPVTLTTTFPFITPAANYTLNVRPLDPMTGDWLSFLDGFGVHGPASGIAVFDAQGRFTLPGFVRPTPALGLNLSAQAAFLDPTAPVGYRITHVRHAERL